MRTLGYKADASTFVSSKYPNKNFSNDKYLCVGKNSLSHFEASSLMKFRFENYNINPNDVVRATLVLYVCKEIVSCESLIGVYANLQDFDENRVNYLTAPQQFKAVGDIYVPPNASSKYINVDITDLCKFWIANPWCNYGLTLRLKTDFNGYYLASTRTKTGPFIVIEYCY
ncbi:MAG: DNRLRE domain-containing protein [Clostridium sp.]